MTLYESGFARYFDQWSTAWVTQISPIIVDWLEGQLPGTRRSALDICCGGGITLKEFLSRDWQATGLDRSPNMLGIAAQRLWDSGLTGTLIEEKVERVPIDLDVDAVTSLDGSLNHLPLGALADVLGRIERTLRPGGILVFDLFEQHHFSHWNSVTLAERPGLHVAKRGVWDESDGHGMLRITGHCTVGSDVFLVDQVLESWFLSEEVVAEALAEAGFRRVILEMPSYSRGCHSGHCPPGKPCRTFYAGSILREHPARVLL